MRGTAIYSAHRLHYELGFSRRRTLAITVDPDGSIRVTAPEGTSLADVENRVRGRGRWILRQRAYFDQFRPRLPKRRFVGGETHLYLGRQYRLKVVAGRQDQV